MLQNNFNNLSSYFPQHAIFKNDWEILSVVINKQ